MDATQQRRAFDQLIAAQRENAAFRQTAALVLGATDALQQRGDGARRAELANEINRTDIDPQLQRSRGDERFQFAALQSIFRIEPQFRGKTSVMRCDSIGAEQFAQMMRHAFGHSARVHENQSGPMRLNQLRQAMINFLPNFIRHHRFKRRLRNFNRQIQFAAMTNVDDLAIRIARPRPLHERADQKTRDFFDRFLRRGQTDSLQRTAFVSAAKRSTLRARCAPRRSSTTA